jgi:dTDP-4-amino-4,6-dideoxygalactose transaminase
VSAHADAKPTPTCEGGLTVTDDAELGSLVRADTDCGVGAGELDPIPATELPPLASGNQRMGEQPAVLLLTQWLRALHARLQARQNRRVADQVINDPTRFATPIVWNPPMDAEYPPFYMYYLTCSKELESEYGLTPTALRAIFTAEGLYAEAPFVPGHQDPAWSEWSAGRRFPIAADIRERGMIIHTKHLRDPEFPAWIGEILDRVVAHRDALRAALI